MREIKFRCWKTNDKTMHVRHPNILIGLDGTPHWQFGYEPPMPESKEEFVLMQATGLKDRNGVEIYEGDIVKTNDMYEPSVVSMIRGCWYVGDWLGGKMLSYWSKEKIEVLGNIYETPELLKDHPND